MDLRKVKDFLGKVMEVLEDSYVQLLVLFVIVVLMYELGFVKGWNIDLKLFAYVLPLFALPVLFRIGGKREKEEFWNEKKVVLILLLLFVLVFGMRMIPYIGNSIPLGYDPGFYKYTMDLYANGLPGIVENSLPGWVKMMFPQGLFVLSSQLWLIGGWSAEIVEKILFPLICALLVLPVYMIGNRLFDKKVGIIAAVLYGVSYTQYAMFTFMYFKNVVGLFLLLLGLFLLERKKYAPMILVYAGLGIYHRPEFLLFSLVLIPWLIKTKDKKLLEAIAITGLMIAPFWFPRLDYNLEVLKGVIGATTSALSGTPGGGGTFFGFEKYEWVSLSYLPFGLIGALYLTIKKKFNSFFFLFVINGAIVLLQLFFYKRLIISLDLVMILMAAIGIRYAIIGYEKIPKKLSYGLLILLIISSGLITVELARNVKPLIGKENLDVIKSLNEMEENAFVMTDTNNAPWVLAYSGRRTIAPGLFEWDNCSKGEWFEFFVTTDLNKTTEFLNRYEKPLYIYAYENLGKEKFENKCFEKINKKLIKWVC
ncbi:MAG: glycosyltransferase family 39 protein [Candidatus Aenigmarchaeota archaeon]|nr:glycosyltransferase family 39 protein [Candidatus Aenigmarchaeota archaeon]